MNTIRHLIDLVETPINDVQAFGYDTETEERTDFDKGISFGEIDRKLISSPKGIQKIIKTFSRTPFNFEIFFVNITTGEIDGDDRKPNDYVDDMSDVYKAGIHDEYFGITGKPGVIRVVMISNLSPLDAKIMMTGWILAHKIGHAIQDHYAENYKRRASFIAKIRELQNAIAYTANNGVKISTSHGLAYPYPFDFDKNLTMKSARSGKLTNQFEMFAELIAQYLVDGKVTFKEPLRKYEERVNAAMASLFTELLGKVLVEV